jgi:hypothetical protein
MIAGNIRLTLIRKIRTIFWNWLLPKIKDEKLKQRLKQFAELTGLSLHV